MTREGDNLLRKLAEITTPRETKGLKSPGWPPRRPFSCSGPDTTKNFLNMVRAVHEKEAGDGSPSGLNQIPEADAAKVALRNILNPDG